MIGLLDNPILLSMLIPLLGAGLILLSGKFPNLRETVTLVTAITLFWNIFGIYQTTQGGQVLQQSCSSRWQGYRSRSRLNHWACCLR